MKFLSVQMPSFGPFTEFRLDFGETPGLQVIYGPNESGKSSSLRAFRALLYGVPTQTVDDFLHQYTQLRVSASLLHSDGRTLDIVRRKGRKNTLKDPSGDDLPESVLSLFIGNLSEAVFDRLYGLDHRTLSSGGKALLEESGKVGESLFAASMGPRFRLVREGLGKEADELWKAKGSKYPINQALAEWKEARQRCKDSTLQGSVYRGLVEDLETEERAVEEARVQIARTKARLKTVSDRARALPLRARYLELQSELEAYTTLPELEPGFSTRREQARLNFERATSELGRLKDEEKRVARELEALPNEWALLAHEEMLEHLYQQCGVLEASQDRLPSLRAEQKALRQSLARIRSNLGADLKLDNESLPSLTLQAQARALSKEFHELKTELQTLELNRDKVTARLTRQQEELESLVEATLLPELESLLVQGRRGAEEERRMDDLSKEMRRQAERIRGALAKLAYWEGSGEELIELSVPSLELIDSVAQQMADLKNQTEASVREIKRTEAQRRKLESGLRQLELSGPIPDQQELTALRAARRDSFLALKKRWEEGEKVSDEQLRAYSEHVKAADALSDRIAQDAERIAQKGRLLQSLAQIQEELSEAQTLHREVSQQQQALEAEWTHQWSDGLTQVRPPQEMRRWISQRESIVEAITHYNETKAEFLELQERRDTTLNQLHGELRALFSEALEPPRLSDAITYSEAKLADFRLSLGKRSKLEEAVGSLRLELEELALRERSCRERLGDWTLRWREAVSSFCPGEPLTPEALDDVLHRVSDLQDLLKQCEANEKALRQAEDEVELFEGRLKQLHQALPPSTRSKGSSLQQVRALHGKLHQARTERAKRAELVQKADELDRAQAVASQAMKEALSVVTTLLNQANATEFDSLPQIEQLVQKRQGLREEMHSVGERLRELGGGSTLEHFCETLSQVSAEELQESAQELEQSLETLETELETRQRNVGQLQERKVQYDGSSRAAQAQEDAAQSLAFGVDQLKLYIRLKLAERLLAEEIENYRLENERPILKKSAHYFERLTCGNYHDLQTGFDDKGTPILEAVASGTGRIVTVEQMSEGTRDQLYLSLRLATIEKRAQHAEPFPLIADDLLVQFDEQRARSALEVLAEFGERHQVLLFTHLSRDRDLAREMSPQKAAVKELERIKL